MKRIGSLVLLVTALIFVSCSSNSNLAGSDAAAKVAGKSCGKVLADLYSQYKSSGTIDPKSSATVKSVTELGTYYTLLKENKSNSSYKKAFTGGLISGSSGLITKKNSSSTVNALMSLSGLSDTASSTGASSSKINTIVSVLTNLFKSLKG